jgi:hypothetical protein
MLLHPTKEKYGTVLLGSDSDNNDNDTLHIILQLKRLGQQQQQQ